MTASRGFRTGLVALHLLLLLAGCDGYTYKGMNGREVRAKADRMSMTDAYNFYLESYAGTAPPMLDAAGALGKYGKQGTDYVIRRARVTASYREFDADIHALLVLSYRCAPEDRRLLLSRASQLGTDTDTVNLVCS